MKQGLQLVKEILAVCRVIAVSLHGASPGPGSCLCNSVGEWHASQPRFGVHFL